MKNYVALSLLFIVWLCGCNEPHRFKSLPEGPVNHHLIALARVKDDVRLRGFAGATPAGSTITLSVKNHQQTTTSNADGSFSLTLAHADQKETAATLTVTVAGNEIQQAYAIKNLAESLKNVVSKPFTTDKEIDSIEFIDTKAYILSSQGALIRGFELDNNFRLHNKPTSAVLLSSGGGPRMITRMGDNLVTTLFNDHEVLVVDNKQSPLAQARLRNAHGDLHLFPIAPPLTLLRPLDADGHGEKTTLSQTAARNAEAVVALDDTHFLVSFANYFQVADPSTHQPSVMGPGIIGLMVLENNKLTTTATLVVPYKNPTQFIKKGPLSFYVSCSGAWQYNQGSFTSQNAGIVRIDIAPDFSSLTAAHQIALPNFAPAPLALVNGFLVIPRSWGSDIAIINETATALLDSDIKTPSYHRAFNFTFATLWHDGVVFLGDNQGSLVAYHIKEGFFPFPFVEPMFFYKDANPQLAIAPLKIYFRNQVQGYDLQSVYKEGFDAWVQTAVHRLLPLDFMQVFGP